MLSHADCVIKHGLIRLSLTVDARAPDLSQTRLIQSTGTRIKKASSIARPIDTNLTQIEALLEGIIDSQDRLGRVSAPLFMEIPQDL